MKKHFKTAQLSMIALGIAINFIGGTIALILRLPIYLDTIGTIIISGLLGPLPGAITGLLSGIISGVTTDVIALYFIPVQIVIGIIAGLLFRTSYFDRWKTVIGVLILTVPSTLISSIIAAFVFGGITSSGSSIIVQLLNKFGLNMTASVFIVQIITDYLDRFITVTLVCYIIKALPENLKTIAKGKNTHGTI